MEKMNLVDSFMSHICKVTSKAIIENIVLPFIYQYVRY